MKYADEFRDRALAVALKLTKYGASEEGVVLSSAWKSSGSLA